MHIMVMELEDLLVGYSRRGKGKDGSLRGGGGLIGRAEGNVFMMTSLFLLLVNQLRGSSLHLLHWLYLSLICSWKELVSFSRSELGRALSTGAAES